MIKGLIPLGARVLMSVVFLHSAWGQILDPAATQHKMAAHGIPFTLLFFAGAIALQVGGGLSVLLGWKTRWGAAALLLFLIPTTLLFHMNFSDQNQVFNFTKNIAIMGGLLMLIRYGPGEISIAGWRARAVQRSRRIVTMNAHQSSQPKEEVRPRA